MSTDTTFDRLEWMRAVCIGEEDHRTHLRAPFRAQRWTVGSDAHRAVAWPVEDGDPKGDVAESVRTRVAGYLEPPEGCRRVETTVDALRTWAMPEEREAEVCRSCLGSCVVICAECGGKGGFGFEGCWSCGGLGKTDCPDCPAKDYRAGWLVDRPVNCDLLHDTLRMAPAGDVTLYLPPNVEHAVHIHAAAQWGWRVLFMPLRMLYYIVAAAEANPFREVQ